MTRFTTMPSPVGDLLLTADDDALTGVWFTRRDGGSPRTPDWRRDDDLPVLAQARRELAEYFAGRREHFDTRLRPQGTDFQRAVWRALRRVRYGRTSTYGALAAAIGRPKAARAVGAAVGANPIAILVPCHRIIGRDGTLTGYAGGLDRKSTLLALEGIDLPLAA